VVLTFPLIKNWLVWNVGDGSKVILGEDLWVGYTENYSMARDMVGALRERGCFYLSQIVDPLNLSIFSHE